MIPKGLISLRSPVVDLFISILIYTNGGSGSTPVLFCALKYLKRNRERKKRGKIVGRTLDGHRELSSLSFPKVHTELFKTVLLYFQSAQYGVWDVPW